MILRIVNNATDEVLLKDEFTKEELPTVIHSWETQVQLYSLNDPPISVRLEIKNGNDVPLEE